MTDYGHELQFGIFITPAADQTQAIVELSKLAEVVGLDLVTFQDHPYQARFLDTWTLLSVVAAQTSTVRWWRWLQTPTACPSCTGPSTC
jgi:alkanesulfonate monooxygenase SsuD/methylene tetrahydromethanopterin reductase-like flavin-dependent oxidoreductase (luciferase family)